MDFKEILSTAIAVAIGMVIGSLIAKKLKLSNFDESFDETEF